MKKVIGILVAAIMFVPGLASAVDFNVTATIPAANGISISATENQMVSGNEVFGPTVTEMNFNPMAFDSANGIWTSVKFFAVDVGATGGAGSPTVTVTYGSESNPTDQIKGLGFKSTATFTKVTGGPAPTDQIETLLAAHGPTLLLNSLSSGENIDSSELIGGFLRMRVGIYDGALAEFNDVGGEPFTNGDLPGSYSGVLTVTATLN